MRCAGGMNYAGARVGHMGDNSGKLELIHKFHCGFPASLDSEAYYSRTAVGQIFLRKRIIFAALKPGIIYPAYFVVAFKEFRNFKRVVGMAFHAQRKRFKA